MRDEIWFAFAMFILGCAIVALGFALMWGKDAKNPGPRYETHCLNGVQYWKIKSAASRSALAPAFNQDGTLLLCKGEKE